LLALFGLSLLFPQLADRLAQPFVALGGRLAAGREASERGGVAASLVLGVATGLLWAPCAGPILGLILTGAALGGARVATLLLLLAYAAGAGASLALALLIGGRVFAAMKRSFGAAEWLRRGLGAAVLAAVAAIAFGLDAGFLTRLSAANTNALEERLLGGFGMAGSKAASTDAAGADLAVEGELPSFEGASAWLNSPPLETRNLKGKVVLVDFWTYSCINCLRTLPYVRAMAEKYKQQGLVVIGVHTPEFAFEKSIDNVRRAVAELGIGYPVAIDNDYAIWQAFDNQYWPAHYFVDAQGRIRGHHFGEGDYEDSERVIRRLLAEAGAARLSETGAKAQVLSAAEAPADLEHAQSPETYVGLARAERFASPGGEVENESRFYEARALGLNEWALFGRWTVDSERATLDAGGGGLVYRFHARDLHLVLGPGASGRARFCVKLDGAPPGENRGADLGADGCGVATEHRLYQLVRQQGPITDRAFEIDFLDPGVEVYAFTFG